MDVWTSDTHEFSWNPEGTLARWTDPGVAYERVFTYDEEGRLTKIERDNGQSVTTAYEYTYTGDGIRHMKKDHLAEKEYRYGCSIDCGGTPLRVYARELGSEDPWVSVEDYLQAGSALGYNENWQFEYSGGELLMMGATGEPNQYYPHDSNGMNVTSAPQACVCFIQPAQSVCAPLGYGGCEGRCEEVSSAIFLTAFGTCIAQIKWPPWVTDLTTCLARCSELDQRCRREADNDYATAKQQCKAQRSSCDVECIVRYPDDRNREICLKGCEAAYEHCLASAAAAFANALRACDSQYDKCRTQCYDRFAPKPAPPKSGAN